MSKGKNNVGRPTKYNSDMCKKALRLFSEGGSVIEVCAEIGICRDTFYEWLKDDRKKEFADTVKKGIQLSEAWWQRKGRVNLSDRDFNYTGWYMNMKNRFGWSDKQHVKTDEGKDANVDLKNASDEELRKIIEG